MILRQVLLFSFICCLWMGIVVGRRSCNNPRRARKTKSKSPTSIGVLTKPEEMIMKELKTIESMMMTDEQREKEQLVRLLKRPPDYNRFELPVLRGKGLYVPINISVEIRIRNIRGVDVLNEELGMELDLITHWTDFAIEKENRKEDSVDRVLDSSFLQEIWWPKVFFSRTVSIIRPDLHGSYKVPRPVKLIINPKEGKVEMATRIVLKLYCPMDFTYYPADTQICNVTLRMYAHSRDDVNLQWKETMPRIPGAYFFNRGHPNYEIYMHNVTTLTESDLSITNSTLVYTVLQFSLSTRRILSFHVMQTYVPSIFLVVITWLAFFIPMELLEARIGISMTILLTLTAMFASIKEYTPQVSYVKAIDTWMLACIVFVFLTLFEFTFLMYLRHVNDKAHQKAIDTTIDKDDDGDFHQHKGGGSHISLIREHQRKTFEKYAKIAKVYKITTSLVETYGFFTVSVGFFIFNFAYWPWLMTYSQYNSFNISADHNEL